MAVDPAQSSNVYLEFYWQGDYKQEEWGISSIRIDSSNTLNKVQGAFNQSLPAVEEQPLVLLDFRNGPMVRSQTLPCTVDFIETIQMSANLFKTVSKKMKEPGTSGAYYEKSSFKSSTSKVTIGTFSAILPGKTYQVKIVHNNNELTATISEKL